MAGEQPRYRLASLTICAAIVLYLAPYVAGWLTAREWPMPPMISDHTYFYVVSSELPVVNGVAENPWYGNHFPERDHPYRRFGGAATLFRLLNRSLDAALVAVPSSGHVPSGNLALALAVWNAGWIALTGAAAWLLFSSKSDAGPMEVLTATAIVLCVSFPHWLLALNTILHGSMPVLSLPFARIFYPQTVVPIMMAYLLAAIAVSRRDRAIAWVLMGLLQAIALVIFPYAVLILAATTALIVVLSKRFTLNVFLFALACALLDALLLLHAGSPTLGAGTSFFSFEPVWPNRLQWALSILCGLMTLAVVLLERDHAIRDVLCAFGIAASVIPAVADSFIAKPVEASIHLYYLVNLAIAILAGWSTMAAAHRFAAARNLVMVVLGLAIACGVVAAFGDGWRPRDWNHQLGDIVRWSRTADLSPGDLVVAQSEADDQPASYLPLLGRPNVLFYYYGEYFVPINDPSEHWDRLALYLHLKGETTASLAALLRQPALLKRSESYILGHRWLRLVGQPSTHDRALGVVEKQLLPRLAGLDQHPERIRERFRKYARIFVIDDAAHPIFSRPRLEESLRFTSSSRVGSFLIVETRSQ